jgi:hypothetical protein
MVRKDVLEMGDTMRGLLEWLWIAAVGPVLAVLGIKISIPMFSGSLSLYPVHTAGYHHEGSSENTLDHVISLP